ncbi:MAG: RHS repeat-associated core domain-containing protein, partial [Sedimentisphaerales bacterium]|nr:RHS repeat-associated core domain-containing protein [Sedimentisphaerales bacterium]
YDQIQGNDNSHSDYGISEGYYMDYQHDRLGSVRQIIDSAGAVVKYYTYEPFGRAVESSDGPQATSDGFMFTGQYFDAQIGEYHLRARQYNPKLARFTARDPVFGDFQQPLTLHKYLYCQNNPINGVDPLGEWAVVIGGSLSGNAQPGLLLNTLTKGFGIMGYSYGLSALVEAEAGVGGTVGSGLAFAHDPDKGWTKGWSFGWVNWRAGGLSVASGSGASLTTDIGISPEANRVRDLGGYFEEVGGSVAVAIPSGCTWLSRIFNNASIGFTASRSVDARGNPTGIHLYTLSAGTGLVGWEGHLYKGKTTAYEWWNN